MDGQIDDQTKAKRARELEEVNKQLRQEFQERMLGKKLEVLFEGERDGYWLGTAGNFLKIKYISDKSLENQVIKLKVKQKNLV